MCYATFIVACTSPHDSTWAPFTSIILNSNNFGFSISIMLQAARRSPIQDPVDQIGISQKAKRSFINFSAGKTGHRGMQASKAFAADDIALVALHSFGKIFINSPPAAEDSTNFPRLDQSPLKKQP